MGTHLQDIEQAYVTFDSTISPSHSWLQATWDQKQEFSGSGSVEFAVANPADTKDRLFVEKSPHISGPVQTCIVQGLTVFSNI